MPSRIARLMLVAVLLLPAGLRNAAAAPNSQRMVVVISLDGFPAYALADARLPIPTIRRLAREGAMAESMRPINPTVTWPNHTAMVTGTDASEHQVLYNGLMVPGAGFEPGRIDPDAPKDKLVRRPTVYDVAHAAGLTTAEVDWVAVLRAPTITWSFAEEPNPDGVIEKELIERGVATRAELADYDRSSPAWRDRIWTEAAVQILTRHQPNLMLYHLLNMDSMHHRYAPLTMASYDAFAFADDRVKQIYDELQKAGLLERTTLLIVSDHGFREVKKQIHPNTLLRTSGLLREVNGKSLPKAWVVPEGGTAMIYVNEADKREGLLPRLQAVFGKAEGIERVYTRDEFAQIGLPQNSDQTPELVLAAKEGYAFSGGDPEQPVTPLAQGGSHGYLNTDPQMQAIFVAWGTGIRRGARLPPISMTDLAPTIGALLGLNMPPMQGQVLRDILE